MSNANLSVLSTQLLLIHLIYRVFYSQIPSSASVQQLGPRRTLQQFPRADRGGILPQARLSSGQPCMASQVCIVIQSVVLHSFVAYLPAVLNTFDQLEVKRLVKWQKNDHKGYGFYPTVPKVSLVAVLFLLLTQGHVQKKHLSSAWTRTSPTRGDLSLNWAIIDRNTEPHENPYVGVIDLGIGFFWLILPLARSSSGLKNIYIYIVIGKSVTKIVT